VDINKEEARNKLRLVVVVTLLACVEGSFFFPKVTA
jgi:hypothetical protein